MEYQLCIVFFSYGKIQDFIVSKAARVRRCIMLYCIKIYHKYVYIYMGGTIYIYYREQREYIFPYFSSPQLQLTDLSVAWYGNWPMWRYMFRTKVIPSHAVPLDVIRAQTWNHSLPGKFAGTLVHGCSSLHLHEFTGFNRYESIAIYQITSRYILTRQQAEMFVVFGEINWVSVRFGQPILGSLGRSLGRSAHAKAIGGSH